MPAVEVRGTVHEGGRGAYWVAFAAADQPCLAFGFSVECGWTRIALGAGKQLVEDGGFGEFVREQGEQLDGRLALAIGPAEEDGQRLCGEGARTGRGREALGLSVQCIFELPATDRQSLLETHGQGHPPKQWLVLEDVRGGKSLAGGELGTEVFALAFGVLAVQVEDRDRVGAAQVGPQERERLDVQGAGGGAQGANAIEKGGLVAGVRIGVRFGEAVECTVREIVLADGLESKVDAGLVPARQVVAVGGRTRVEQLVPPEQAGTGVALEEEQPQGRAPGEARGSIAQGLQQALQQVQALGGVVDDDEGGALPKPVAHG